MRKHILMPRVATPPLVTLSLVLLFAGCGRTPGYERRELSRDKVMKWYSDLTAEPARLVKLYDSFEPIHANGAVTGHTLKIKGEEAFLRDVGLEERDIIRRVNFTPMTSRAAAEHYIGEVLENNLDTLTIEVERDGSPLTLEYVLKADSPTNESSTTP